VSQALESEQDRLRNEVQSATEEVKRLRQQASEQVRRNISAMQCRRDCAIVFRVCVGATLHTDAVALRCVTLRCVAMCVPASLSVDGPGAVCSRSR
jgi:hypothetical protein